MSRAFHCLQSIRPRLSNPAYPSTKAYYHHSPSLNDSATLDYSPYFGIQLQYQEGYPVVNLLGLYLNAINVLYILSGHELRKTWDHFEYSLVHFPITIDIYPFPTEAGKLLQTRFLLWGLQYMCLDIYKNRQYKPVVALLSWRDQKVGLIDTRQLFSHATVRAGNATQRDNNGTISLGTATSGVGVRSLNVSGLEVLYEFSDQGLPSMGVFTTAVRAIVAVAEEGLDKQCETLEVCQLESAYPVCLSFTADPDARGSVRLRYEHIREAIKLTVFAMTYHGWRLKEMTITLRLDGEEIAEGKWKWLSGLAEVGVA